MKKTIPSTPQRTKKSGKTPQMLQNNLISPKKTLLEQLYLKGWLDYPASKFSAEDRLNCGLRLQYQYQILQRANLHSGFIFNQRIDLSPSLESRMYSDALDAYRRYMRAVPSEFWGIVRQICLEERLPPKPAGLSERQFSHYTYLYRADLCRGLDRLLQSCPHSAKPL
ncbi:MAG: hypothetical protein IJ529_00110 [Alphaproteobacteria bacterium]|nr:hypothetical protein [Alphaproteobacteria bacterium]MBQ9235110.1 hypothetical protein [Alphaproteobacteria bacterium]